MQSLNAAGLETTWNQERVRVALKLEAKDSAFVAQTSLDKSAIQTEVDDLRSFVRNLMTGLDKRNSIGGIVLGGRRIEVSDEGGKTVKKIQWEISLKDAYIFCASPSAARRLLALPPILTHPTYAISFQPYPTSAHVDSCCTLKIRIADSCTSAYIDTFCALAAEIFGEGSLGKRHSVTPVRQWAAADGTWGIVTTSDIYLAHFLTQVICHPIHRFQHLYQQNIPAYLEEELEKIVPNDRRRKVLTELEPLIEQMIEARKTKSRDDMAKARLAALDIVRNLAITAEIYRIGDRQLTEATGRLERVQRDLDKLTSSEMALDLENVESLCGRVQKSMAEMSSVEIALARVEKWYREKQEKEKQDKKQKMDAGETLVVPASVSTVVPSKRILAEELTEVEEEDSTALRTYKQPRTGLDVSDVTGTSVNALRLVRRQVSFAEYAAMAKARKEANAGDVREAEQEDEGSSTGQQTVQ